MIKPIQRSCLFFCLCFFLVNVLSAESDVQIDCIDSIAKPCIEKCDNSGGSDCKDLCQQNAVNECRQAGE